MRVQFNPSGTGVRKGLLGGRFDVYPDPTSKTYPLQHVLKPDKPIPLSLFNLDGTVKEPDYSNWWAAVAKHYEVNPMLCAFFTLPESVTLETAKTYLSQVFTKNRLATLDSVLVLPNSADYVSPYMRNRCRFGTPVKTRDYADLIASVNQKLSLLAVDITGGTAEMIEPQTIDVGVAATDRATNNSDGRTAFNVANPANATGTLDTVKIWLWSNAVPNSVRAGTTFLVSGTTYQCNDSEEMGNVAAGSEQTITGLTIAVSTDDYLAYYGLPGVRIELDTTGGTGVREYIGEALDAGDQADYGVWGTGTCSLYGTGVETTVGIVRQMMEYHGG